MEVGVISDVHGNLPALDAVFEDMPAVDALVNAGDVVGYNPWPRECVRAMRERSVPTVLGNHDRAVVDETEFRFNDMAAAGVRHARRALDGEQLAWLDGLPDQRRLFETVSASSTVTRIIPTTTPIPTSSRRRCSTARTSS